MRTDKNRGGRKSRPHSLAENVREVVVVDDDDDDDDDNDDDDDDEDDLCLADGDTSIKSFRQNILGALPPLLREK